MATTEAWVELFINTSFRDGADKDYILARIAYRLGLTQPFLWSSLQAIEKYLKAILLYNHQSTLRLQHDVMRARQGLSKIPDIPFAWPAHVDKFIEYINDEGPNRYRSYPSSLMEDSLLGLDRTVWHLRRYCYNMRGLRPELSAQRLADELAALQQDPLEYRHKFHIKGGFLEGVLGGRSPLRMHLVWKNFWFGSKRRRHIAQFPMRERWSRPIHFKQPEVYHALKTLVQFEGPVRDYFEKASGARARAQKNRTA